MDSKIIFVVSRGEPGVGFLRRVVSGSSSAFSVEIFGSGETLTLQAVGAWQLVGGPSSGMAQDSAAKPRYREGRNRKIMDSKIIFGVSRA